MRTAKEQSQLQKKYRIEWEEERDLKDLTKIEELLNIAYKRTPKYITYSASENPLTGKAELSSRVIQQLEEERKYEVEEDKTREGLYKISWE